MIRTLLSLCMLLSALASAAPQETGTVLAMKSGVLLRMHVVAQDDSAEMQRIKLCVRDAVRQTYASGNTGGPMLAQATAMLPRLTRAARQAAAREGYTGVISVTVERLSFDQRTLDGLTIPAGEYPALMIRMGEARGHNWWGLIDPELALRCVRWGKTGWDWSLRGLWMALLGAEQEVVCP